jgi:hypothetical protein
MRQEDADRKSNYSSRDGVRVDRLDRMPALSTGVRNEGYGTQKRLSSKSGWCRCAAFLAWAGLWNAF